MLQRMIAGTFKDPIGLTMRLVRSHDPDAYFAMAATFLSTLTAPLDRLLETQERRIYASAAPPQRPIIFVTGAPRSGTTLLSQVLVHHLPVTYFNNLSALFPRAPIMANRLLGRFLRPPTPTYRSYYGWMRGFGASGNCLHLWDRWMGHNRYLVPERFDAATADALMRFFGAYEAAAGKPILNKSNQLATCATLLAGTLPTSRFIFVCRDRAFAVQSILGAREKIQGSTHAQYGVQDPAYRHQEPQPDPIEAVCAQVLYHERMMHQQQRELGTKRVWIIPYEEFCREPHRIVLRVADEILGIPLSAHTLRLSLRPFHDTNRITRPRAEFEKILETLDRLSAHPALAAGDAA
jgi:sulfotransferase family protein